MKKEENDQKVEDIELSDEEDEDLSLGYVAETDPIQSVEKKEVNITLADPVENLGQNISAVLQGQVAQVESDSNEYFVAESFDDEAQIANDNPGLKKKADSDPVQIRGFASIPNQSGPTVAGRVTDDTGEGLPGVNVLIKGTTTGTQTDIDGYYSLTM